MNPNPFLSPDNQPTAVVAPIRAPSIVESSVNGPPAPPPVAAQAQPAPQFDWNRYEVPKPEVNRFVSSADTLDNLTAFQTTSDVPPQNPKTRDVLGLPSHRHFAKRAAIAAGIVILIGLGASLASFKNSSNSSANIATSTQSAKLDSIQSGINQSILKINRDTTVAGGKTFTATGPVIIQNENNSATAFKIQNAAGNNLFIADTLNNRVGLGVTPTGNAALQVGGDISSNGRVISAGGVSIGADGLKFGDFLVCSARGCISSSSPSPTPSNPTIDVANVAFLNKNQTITGNNSFSGTSDFTNATGTFSGNGAGLTNVNATQLNGQTASYYTNASNLNSGTVNDARLSTNIARLASDQTFTGKNTFKNSVDSALAFQIQNSTFNNLFVADTSANRIAIAQNNANYTLDVGGDVNTLGIYRINGIPLASSHLSDSSSITKQGNSFNGASQLVKNNPSGDLPALSGINLTSLNAGALASGTVNDLRLSNNVTLQGNTFNGASQLLQLTNTALYPALNGSLITNINASNIASGTINDTRLSSNVAFLGAGSQTFTGNNTFSSIITAPGLETVNNGHIIAVGFAGTSTGALTYNFDNTATPGTYNICTTAGNCAGAGGNVTATGGTTNKLAKFTAGTAIGDSILSDNGTTVSVGGILNATTLKQNSNAVCDVSGNCAGVGGQVGTSGTPTTGTVALFSGSATIGNSIITQSAGTVGIAGNLNLTGSSTYQLNGSQVTSSILSNDSNLAKISANNSFSGNNTFTGTVLAKNSSNSTGAFQIQNAAGTSNLFIADTTNSRIGIGIQPAYTLDVNGDINIATGSSFRINGVAICGPSATCAPSSGSNSYVQNNASLQTNANFNIQSVNSGSVVGIVRGTTGQTADLFRAQDENGANVLRVGKTGDIIVQPSTNSTTAFQIQNAAGTSNLFIADTSANKIAIAQASATYQLDVGGDINSTTGIRVGGTLLCASGGCLAASGSGSYIQNGTAQQTNANFNIKNTNVNNVAGVIEGANGQVADIFDVQSHAGTTKYLKVDSGGNVGIGVSGTPGQKLEVNGSIRLGAGSLIGFGASDTIRFQDGGTNVLNIYTNNILQLSLDASGNLTLSGNGLLVMGAKASDPTCTTGATYYNSTTNSFRGCQGPGGATAWMDLISPPGTVMSYAGSSAPAGYFIADGSAVSRTTYSRLFAVVGTTYGAGDGSTTFNLPDLRGRTAVGLNTSETTRTDVTALGNNEGAVLGSRTPYHKSTKNGSASVTGSNSSISLGGSNSSISWSGGNSTISLNANVDTFNHAPSSGSTGTAGGDRNLVNLGLNGSNSTWSFSGSNSSLFLSGSNSTIGVSDTITVGPQTNTPTDTGAYLTLNYIIKF